MIRLKTIIKNNVLGNCDRNTNFPILRKISVKTLTEDDLEKYWLPHVEFIFMSVLIRVFGL